MQSLTSFGTKGEREGERKGDVGCVRVRIEVGTTKTQAWFTEYLETCWPPGESRTKAERCERVTMRLTDTSIWEEEKGLNRSESDADFRALIT
jgi:hypothetical protein